LYIKNNSNLKFIARLHLISVIFLPRDAH